MGRLDVRVVGARNLADTQWVSKPDPYVILKLESQKHKTTVKENCLNPEWNEIFKFTVADENSSQLRVEVWNSNVVSDELMGVYTLSLSGLVRGVVRDEWFLLQQCKSNAEIRLRVLAHDFGRTPGGAAPVAGPGGAPALAGGGGVAQGIPLQQQPPGAYPAPFQQTGGQQYVAPAPSMPQQPQQQQPPPARVVNPMPAYGAPQPTYGAPQPAYGAPPQAFGGYGGAVPVQQVSYGGAAAPMYGGGAMPGYSAPPPSQPPAPFLGYGAPPPQPQQSPLGAPGPMGYQQSFGAFPPQQPVPPPQGMPPPLFGQPSAPQYGLGYPPPPPPAQGNPYY